jgi:hypothetical protein
LIKSSTTSVALFAKYTVRIVATQNIAVSIDHGDPKYLATVQQIKVPNIDSNGTETKAVIFLSLS